MEVGRNVVRSPYMSIPIPQTDAYSTFLQTFKHKQDKIALVDTLTQQTYTFREAERRITSVARRLVHDGFRKGDRMALCCTNCVDYPIFMAAVLRLGGVAVGVNHILMPGEIKQQCDCVGAKFMFTGDAITSKVLEAVKGTSIKVYIIGEVVPSSHVSVSDIYNQSSSHYPQLPALGDLDIDAVRDPAFILFSSGTTGLPKPVLLSHTALNATSFNLNHPEVCKVPESMVVYQPMCHVFGMNLICTTFTFGITTYVMHRFDLEKYIQLIAEKKITMMHVVPPVATMISKSPLLDKYDLSHVLNICSGAGPIGATTEGLVKQRLKSQHARFRQVYGLTETAGIVTLTPASSHPLADIPPGSVGLLAPNTQAQVIDLNTGLPLGVNEEGEIWIRGPQLMLGYEGRPEATRETVDQHGWLHTGDIGKYDKDGYFFITDRLKELIKYKGYQVAPVELEKYLLSHDQVMDVAVFSVDDPLAGELPRAWVIHKPGSLVTQSQLHEFINKKVAPYKRLRGGIRFVSEIPRSASGKILRRVIKQLDQTSSKL